MRAYSSMPIQDFTAQLRDIAIKANARPAVIYMIDQLDTAPTPEDIEADQEAAIVAAEHGEHCRTWEICFDAVEDALRDRKGSLKLGITEEQFDAIMGALKNVEPER